MVIPAHRIPDSKGYAELHFDNGCNADCIITIRDTALPTFARELNAYLKMRGINP